MSILDAVQEHNRGRDPSRLARKLARMRESPFVFLRGACHHFYDALVRAPVLDDAPAAWCCGDLHFENFGSYKANNRQVYFDINDFDEAALAPCTFDLVRLLTSLHCGATALQISDGDARELARLTVSAWRDALVAGKPLWVERETATGLVKDLLSTLQERTRPVHLDGRTVRVGESRRLITDGEKALPLSPAERASIDAFMEDHASGTTRPAFFRVIDAAHRIAGTGSLGVRRFVVLVEGKGSPDGNYLLDLKEALPSSLIRRLEGTLPQPPGDEAERVVAAQNRLQCVNHAFLHAVRFEGRPFVLRGLQPTEDRVSLTRARPASLRALVDTLGRILAWNQLRASGRAGAATADELAAFAARPATTTDILEVAEVMASHTHAAWEAFREELGP